MASSQLQMWYCFMSSNMKRLCPGHWAALMMLFWRSTALWSFSGSVILNCPYVFWSAQQSPVGLFPSFFLLFILASSLPLSLSLPFLLSFSPFLPLLLCSERIYDNRSLIKISTQHSRRRNLLFYKNRITLPFLFHGFCFPGFFLFCLSRC